MLLWAMAASAVLARADTIRLKNGNEMEGVVTAQTRDEITLDFGYGSTVIPRADIDKIVRAPRKKGAAQQREVTRRKYETGLEVPAGAEKLDALYRSALVLREKALDSKSRVAELDDEAARLTESMPERQAAYRAQTRDFQNLRPGQPGYNEAIGEVNRAGVSLQSDAVRIQEIEREKKQADGAVASYIEAYRKLEDYLSGAGKGLRALKGDYGAWISSELKAMEADFQRQEVPVERQGAALFADVMINGSTRARMLVDTGATTTLLYKELADRLRLPAGAKLGTARASVADGRSAEVTMVRLDSLALGDSVVRGSEAAIYPAGGQGFDGLLGMSFLGKFIVRVDAANGRLILEDLKKP